MTVEDGDVGLRMHCGACADNAAVRLPLSDVCFVHDNMQLATHSWSTSSICSHLAAEGSFVHLVKAFQAVLELMRNLVDFIDVQLHSCAVCQRV